MMTLGCEASCQSYSGLALKQAFLKIFNGRAATASHWRCIHHGRVSGMAMWCASALLFAARTKGR